MKRRKFLTAAGASLATLSAATTVLASDDRNVHLAIIDDLEDVLRKHKLGVPGHASTRILARYLYRTLVVFAEMSALRDRER